MSHCITPQDVITVYDFLAAYIAEHGRAPTLRQIAAATDCGSISTVRRILIKLRWQGRLDWHYHKQHTLHLLADEQPISQEGEHNG